MSDEESCQQEEDDLHHDEEDGPPEAVQLGLHTILVVQFQDLVREDLHLRLGKVLARHTVP